MGPHFFKCGKSPSYGDFERELSLLQWGRTFSSAESLWITFRISIFDERFNGAALFQVRKVGEKL